MKKGPIKIVLAGCGGYGRNYWRQLLNPPPDVAIRVIGLVDPKPPTETPEALQSHALDLPFYDDLETCLKSEPADLVILATPIHLHAPQTLLALAHGACVICEKPVAATVQDALAMREAERQAGRFVAIGYQASYSDAVQALKRDIGKGLFGRPLCLKTFYSWPRTANYYHRNNWAGALQSERGDWVLDSPVNNATAHFLHNMFYVLGEHTDASARPLKVQAECYRANAIANYDTAMLRCHTAQDAEILFYSSHAVPSTIGPVFHYTFECGCVSYVSAEPHGILAHLPNGKVKHYGSPFGNFAENFWRLVKTVRTNERPVCGIEAAAAHTLCVNGVQESSDGTTPFPAELVQNSGEGPDRLTWVESLQTVMLSCYERGRLPGEHGGIPWARSGQEVDLRDYGHFPQQPEAKTVKNHEA